MNKIVYLFILLFALGKLYGQSTTGVENQKRELTLNDAIEIGLKNNPEVKSAIENISASKGRFWSGISLPSSEISVRYEWTPKDKSLRSFSERTQEVNQSFEFPTNYFLKGSKFSKEE